LTKTKLSVYLICRAGAPFTAPGAWCDGRDAPGGEAA